MDILVFPLFFFFASSAGPKRSLISPPFEPIRAPLAVHCFGIAVVSLPLTAIAQTLLGFFAICRRSPPFGAPALLDVGCDLLALCSSLFKVHRPAFLFVIWVVGRPSVRYSLGILRDPRRPPSAVHSSSIHRSTFELPAASNPFVVVLGLLGLNLHCSLLRYSVCW